MDGEQVEKRQAKGTDAYGCGRCIPGEDVVWRVLLMQPEEATRFYNTVLGIAAVPVLLLILWFCWVVTNYLMSPQWQQARRSKQIRKAIAARQKRLAASLPADDGNNVDG